MRSGRCGAVRETAGRAARRLQRFVRVAWEALRGAHSRRRGKASVGSRAVVIGVGNEARRDDGAGFEVARRVRAMQPPGVGVVLVAGDAAALLDAWVGADVAVVVDAARTGAVPGTVRRVEDAGAGLGRLGLRCSTHALPVDAAIALGRELGRLPPRLVVYAVEGGEFGIGQGLSPEVAGAIDTVVERVVSELAPPVSATRSLRARWASIQLSRRSH